MSASPPPFDRADLPRHTRVLPGPVTAAYDAVTDVARWPAWMPNLLEPVITKSSDHFLFRASRDGRIEHHEGTVILRGPTHTFAVQVGEARLWFRTRPNAAGTKVDVVLERSAPGSMRLRVGGRRRRARDEQWVEAVLDGLAAHLEPLA